MNRIKPFLKTLLPPIAVPIFSGPLRGKRWLLGNSMRYFYGRYVPRDAGVFLKEVKPGDTVYDVGAHVGYFTVLASTLAGESGRVVAFEPLPMNLRYLRRHLALNGCENVIVREACVAELDGEARFDDTRGSGTGRLSPDGRRHVSVVSLDRIVGSGEAPPPSFVKVNVEGAESAVLRGARRTIERNRPVFLVTLHDGEQRTLCENVFRAAGYEVSEIGRDAILARPRAAPPAAGSTA